MIYVATENGRTKKYPTPLFWCFCWFRDPGCVIWEKHLGSATLVSVL